MFHRNRKRLACCKDARRVGRIAIRSLTKRTEQNFTARTVSEKTTKKKQTTRDLRGQIMMEEKTIIQLCSMEHLDEYGRIYAAAFSGEPWNDPWKPEDAVIHVKELLESEQA